MCLGADVGMAWAATHQKAGREETARRGNEEAGRWTASAERPGCADDRETKTGEESREASNVTGPGVKRQGNASANAALACGGRPGNDVF